MFVVFLCDFCHLYLIWYLGLHYFGLPYSYTEKMILKNQMFTVANDFADILQTL